jgi:hypothetical protein
VKTPTELERALADAGGARAPLELTARLRGLLATELGRGQAELALSRTGYERPIVLALAAGQAGVLAALPVPVELRADPGAVGDRAAELAALAVGKLVEAEDPGPPDGPEALDLRLGDLGGHLALAYPSAKPEDAADYAREALDEALSGIDRLRARAQLVPAHVLDSVTDLRPPIGATHPLRVAEAVTRLGGTPLDDDSVEALGQELLRLLEPAASLARPHDDPVPRRRAMRRILQRLDGMGKWGGYHTAFDHLARGFAGHERQLAFEVGEQLVSADLLTDKPSVGQRHVSLNPRRAGEIRRLIDTGELPPGLDGR